MRRIPPALVALTGLVLVVDVGLLAFGDIGSDDDSTGGAVGATTTSAVFPDGSTTMLDVTTTLGGTPAPVGPGGPGGPTPPGGPGSGLTSDGAGDVADGGDPLADTGGPGAPLLLLGAAVGAAGLATAAVRRRSVTLVACADGSPAPSGPSS